MILLKASFISSHASPNCSVFALSIARATTKFAIGCAASRTSFPLKYVDQRYEKARSGDRVTSVSNRWEDVTSRKRVDRYSDSAGTDEESSSTNRVSIVLTSQHKERTI